MHSLRLLSFPLLVSTPAFVSVVFCFSVWFGFDLISPEFSYRPGLSVLSEDTNNAASTHGGAGPPNRPLPPTPDDDDQQGDRTLIMKRVSWSISMGIQFSLSCSSCIVY